MTLSVGIMGAGAVGCHIGGHLAAAGSSVVFVARGRYKAELESFDLRLTGLGGSPVVVERSRFSVSGEPAALADSDVVLVCVKSAESAKTGELLAPVLRADALVGSMQNGVRNADELRKKLGDRTVLGGIVGFNVVPKGEGALHQATTGPLVIEWSEHPRFAQLVRAMKSGGLAVEVSHDIRGAQWAKLLMNLNNAVSALTGAPTRDLIFEAPYRRIVAGLIGEALHVMRAAGVKPARLGAIPPALFPLLLKLPSVVLRAVARVQLDVDPDARSSMHEDFVRGRPTEVDDLNGEIVRLAEGSGAVAPKNRRIVELVHAAEKKAAGCPEMSADALWSALSSS